MCDFVVDERNRLAPNDWTKLRDVFVAAYRPYAQQSYITNLINWEDPDARIRERVLMAALRNPASISEVIDSLPNRIAIYEIVAKQNIGMDWIVTADIYSRIDNVTSEERSMLMDTVIGQWVVEEGTQIATAWLAAHANDPVYDMARRTVYLANPNEPILLKQMSSPQAQALTVRMATALGGPLRP